MPFTAPSVRARGKRRRCNNISVPSPFPSHDILIIIALSTPLFALGPTSVCLTILQQLDVRGADIDELTSFTSVHSALRQTLVTRKDASPYGHVQPWAVRARRDGLSRRDRPLHSLQAMDWLDPHSQPQERPFDEVSRLRGLASCWQRTGHPSPKSIYTQTEKRCSR